MTLARELLYAVRTLVRAPSTTAIGVLALALGIGANTTTLSGVVSLVLRPYPFPKSDRIVTLQHTDLRHGGGSNVVSSAEFLAWRDESASFERVAAFAWSRRTLSGVAEPRLLSGAVVSADFFPLLGVAPTMGRVFRPEESEPGHDGVIVLSHRLWRRLFSGRNPLDRTLSLDDHVYSVVGVMPSDFEFPPGAEYWEPLALTAQHRAWTKGRSWAVLARLRPGVSFETAGAEMTVIAAREAKEHPSTNEGLGVRVLTLGQMTATQSRRFVLIGLAAAAFVLLLACVNVSNLLLARAISRRHEVAVRAALGANRLRIARLFLLEALVLAVLGGVGGALLGAWGLHLSRAAIPEQVYKWVPGLRQLHVDGTVLGATALLAVVTGLACGLLAAWHATRAGTLAAGLAEDGRGQVSGIGGLRRLLVTAEVALALVLLVAAGAMAKTYARLARFEIGVDPRNVLQMSVALPNTRYPDMGSIARYGDDAVARLEAIPGVAAAAVANLGGAAITDFRIVGQPPPASGTGVPDLHLVTHHYFSAVGLPVLRGRSFQKEDELVGATTVAVLSESVVRRYWRSGGEVVGSVLSIPNYRFPPFRVIGVVGDLRDWFSHEPRPILYVLNAQMPQRSLQLFVRTAGDPMTLATRVRAEVQAVDRGQPIEDFRTMERDLWEQSSGVRLSAAQMTIFAGIALLLATTGIYGVVAFSVARRTREMGVRMALGATGRDVLRLVVGQSLRTTGVGIAIGLAVAFAAMRTMALALYDVVQLDPPIFLGMSLILAACAALAAYVPALRAARVDPMLALRDQ